MNNSETNNKLSQDQLDELLNMGASTIEKREQKEGKIQIRCMKSFKAGYPLLADYITHMKNEEPNAKRRMISAAMGVVSGYPDLMLFVPADYTEVSYVEDNIAHWHTHFNGLAIELKNGKHGRQTLDQKICQMRLEACGYKYELVRSEEEFGNVVKNYVKHISDQTLMAINRANVEADKIREAERIKKDKKDSERARKELQRMIANA